MAINPDEVQWDDEPTGIDVNQVQWDAPTSTVSAPAIPQPKQSKLKVPNTLRMLGQSVVKGAAAVPDMFLNTPENIANLVKIPVGVAATELGYPEYAPEMTDYTLNPTKRGLTSAGVIKPEYEPVTGGQRILDAMVQGATGGLLTGGTNIAPNLINTAAGATSAGVSQGFTEAGYPKLGIAAGLATAPAVMYAGNRTLGVGRVDAARQQQNSLRDANIREAREAGYVIPPSQSNPESILANTADIIAGGRPRMQQTASIKNAPIVTKQIAKDLGLPENAPITKDALETLRYEASVKGYEPIRNAGEIKTTQAFYDDLDKITQSSKNAKRSFPGAKDTGVNDIVKSISVDKFDSNDAVDMIAILRANASDAYASGNSTLGKANKSAANALESAIETHLKESGQNDLLNNFKNARQLMAKTYSVEKALNTETGTVSAKKLGAQLQRGKPLSGAQLSAAKASLLPGDSLADVKYATTGASQLESVASAAPALASGNPLYLGIPFARKAMRNALLTPTAQRVLGTPQYIDPSLGANNLVNALMMSARQGQSQ